MKEYLKILNSRAVNSKYTLETNQNQREIEMEFYISPTETSIRMVERGRGGGRGKGVPTRCQPEVQVTVRRTKLPLGKCNNNKNIAV